MTGWIVVAVIVTFLFIAFDVVKGMRKQSRRPQTQMERVSRESVSRESERMVKIEAEVAGKVEELKRHSPPPDAAPAAPAPAAQANGRDTMDDTRCMKAVKEKAEEIERLGRERGVGKA